MKLSGLILMLKNLCMPNALLVQKLGLDTYSNTNGFFTEYSKSTASEDMAEVFSHLMIGSDLKNIDPILKQKIQFIKTNILKIDQNFIL